ncbi:hypothetical protein SDC9_155862 [bioreactor metagenome]|uniref:Uncharacterized protein n=1 Tax=bioreactor metagenome TaxID=1076179 RepID=A0A645F580_9ZZZZ
MDLRTVGYIVANGHGERIRFLEDHADLLSYFDHIGARVVYVLSMEHHPAFDPAAVYQVVHPVYAPYQGGFPAP